MNEIVESSLHTPITNTSKSFQSLTTCQGGHSLAGRRYKNEDYFHMDGRHNLWIISDGIGGAPFGEVISRVACNYFARTWGKSEFMELEVKKRLAACLDETDSYVNDLSDLLGGNGSGATFTAACYLSGSLSMVSIGDSRAYFLRDGNLQHVCGDGRASGYSNTLDQALGYHMELHPSIVTIFPEPGDILLLCTDGVWSTQSNQTIVSSLLGELQTRQELLESGNPQRMAYQVVENADMSDNATAVVVLFTSDPVMN